MTNKPESIEEGDAEQLRDLFSSGGRFVSARGLSDYWLYARLFGSTCLCVRDDAGKPVAVVIAFRDQTPGVNEIYIQDVVVRSDHRRQGLGGMVLEELHRRAADWGINRIWLTSEAENAAAMQLWHQFGYVNPEADYQQAGVWLTRNLKGAGRDRAMYECRLET